MFHSTVLLAGYSYVAVCTHQNHASIATELALRMINVASCVRGELAAFHGVENKFNEADSAANERELTRHGLRVRIGVHSGPVVAGVTSSKVPKYTLFGMHFLF